MSPKNSLLTAGLTALGLFGFAPLGVADSAPPAPSGSEASVAPTPSHAVLLLTNGRLHEGTLSEGGSHYFVHTKTNKLPIPKRDVEKIGRSVREIYQYLLERLPARDPDEHMKLALWCLTQEMTAEATEQLKEVVALSPNNMRALSMLDKIGGTAEREMRRDPAVTQAGAEVADDRPESLNSAVLARAQRELGISDLPQIPGLPKALAVKRAGEFARLVDPVIQFRCAKCHNEQFDGSFQLVQYKSKSDRSVDARRANLDAVLALIDMENPAKSELLSSTLRAHGGGNRPKPIFTGSNDRHYQILATWVNSLRVAPTAVATQPSPRFATPAPSGAETFASGRNAQVPLPTLTPTPPTTGRFDSVAPPSQIPPPLPPGQYPAGTDVPVSNPAMTAASPYPSNVRVTTHTGDKDHPDLAPGAAFPTPFAVSGARPNLESAPGAAMPPLPPTDPATGAPLGVATGAIPGAVVPGAPGLPPASSGVPPAAAIPATSSGAPKKPVKLDPALLEKALMNRYAPR